MGSGVIDTQRSALQIWRHRTGASPRWPITCAAAGERTELNPHSITERMPRSEDNAVTRNDLRDQLDSTTDLTAEDIGEDLDAVCFEVRRLQDDVSPVSCRRLQVDVACHPVAA